MDQQLGTNTYEVSINEIYDGYKFSADFKLLNIVCGLGQHSSKYPCVIFFRPIFKSIFFVNTFKSL